jgi:choline dehydrogenase-like flavoprotein
METVFDYLIVGSGAGGAAAAYHLARSGAQVALIEKGGSLPTDGSTLDVQRVFRQGAFLSREAWIDRRGRPLAPQEHANLGGKTKWYGAALLRFQPHEVEGDAAHQCLGWPISYDDLAPYYAQAEGLLGVRHFAIEPDLRGILERMHAADGGWPSGPLSLGLAPEILDHPVEARHFDGFASVRGLKFDAEVGLLDRVRSLPNLHLMTQQAVTALVAQEGAPRRVAGVIGADGTRFRAAKVLLAAGALHSPRLLHGYLEASGLVDRLAGADLVGRYYKCHLNTALLAVSPAVKSDLLRKTVLFLDERFPHSSVQTLGWMDGEIVAAQLPPYAPRWLADLIGRRAYGFWLTTEDGSDRRNRVVARPDGPPQLDYDMRRLPPAHAEHRRLVRAFRARLLRAGLIGFTKPIPLEGTAHACGTLVCGSDPERSVVDGSGRVHGLENLYVVDGSVLPRASRVNPALTIYAWALRVAALLEPHGAGR